MDSLFKFHATLSLTIGTYMVCGMHMYDYSIVYWMLLNTCMYVVRLLTCSALK